MKTFAAKLALPTIIFNTAMSACAAEADQATPAHDTPKMTVAFSTSRAIRRVEPPEDLRFNHGRSVQFVERTRFSQQDREKMRAFHDEYMAAHAAPLPAELACPQTQRYAEGILDRLIDASNLRPAMQGADFPVHLVVTCGVVDHPDAEMKAGVLAVSAELMLEMASEDEVAAMLGHELAHYTLAHASKTLEVYPRLTPYSARSLSITHELEADAEGLILLANAGYDPYAAVDALKSMQAVLHKRGLQSDSVHPEIDDRIRRLRQQIARADWIALPRRTRGLTAAQEEIKRRPMALLQKREGTH